MLFRSAKLPGIPELVSSDKELKVLAAYDTGDFKYSVSDYQAMPNSLFFKLSPNGKYLSYLEKEDLRYNINIKEISTGEVTRVVEEKEEIIIYYYWVNNERLIYLKDKGGDENYHIYAVDIDGKNETDLTPFAGVKAQVLSILKEQKDYIIISMNKDNPQIEEPYRLNVFTGEFTKLHENNDHGSPIDMYYFDKEGNLRAYSKLADGINLEFYYKNSETGDFDLKVKGNWEDTFSILSFNYNSPDPDDAFILTNLTSDKSRIVLYDLKKNKEIKEMYSNPTYDLENMRLSRKRNYEVDFFRYEGGKLEMVPVSDLYKEIHEGVKSNFPGKVYWVPEYDDEENNFLIYLYSDKLSGAYYVYDVSAKQFKLLYELMPQLKEEDMADMLPIKFQSRDGLTIHGYITLPKEALEGKKVPLIVNPHGGPHFVRSWWGFNPDAQLFASRGYATLHVDFRISGGYGKEFLRAGFKQVGRKAMDDVEDGIHYVISQGWIDEDRIAIYGVSHGGYATLMGLVKTPDLYRCGVDYVGISNVETFFASLPEYWKPFIEMIKVIWYNLDDPAERVIAIEVSPVYQVDKISKPIFVVQGANDPRVNISESDQIVAALRAKGLEVPYMVKYDEGHGFYKDENTLDFYNTMMGFLAKYLK